MTRLPLRSSAIRRDPALPQRIPHRRREGSRDDVRTRRRRREGKRMCCCLRGPKWRRGVAAAGTVSRVTSASGAGASHGAAVAAAVGVGVVRVAAWTFRMGTDGGGSSAGPARVGMREGGRSRRHARPRGRRRLCPPPPHPRHFFPSWPTFSTPATSSPTEH